MATKVIAGTTITTGYVLSSSFDVITISSTGAIHGVSGSTTSNSGPTIGVAGGIGLDLPASATALNGGVLLGGNGAAGGYTGSGAGGAGGVGGAAVYFEAGGTLANAATITGGVGGRGGAGSLGNAVGGVGGAGVAMAGSGSVGNNGQITGGVGGVGGAGRTGGALVGGTSGAGGAGIYFTGAETLNNSGTIFGGQGGQGSLNYGAGGGNGGAGGVGVMQSGAASILNYGLIQGGAGGAAYASEGSAAGGNGGAAIVLHGGGIVDNFSTIADGAGGLGAGGKPNGLQGNGIMLLTSGGVVNNGDASHTTALISGVVGVYAGAGAPATVTNFGTISGASTGVAFHSGSTSDRLIVEAGSTIIGGAYGGGGSLELAGGTGYISGLGGSGLLSGAVSAAFDNFGSYVVDSGGYWALTGANSIGASQTFTNGGTVAIAPNATLTDAGILTNPGEIDIVGGAAHPPAYVRPPLSGTRTTLVVGAPAFAALEVSGNRTLSGGGVVSLNAYGFISGVTSGDTLTNLDNTIEGGGFIKGPLTLINDGTVDANVGRMVINTADTVTNHGLVESSGEGILLIRDTTINSAGGGSVIDGKILQLDNATLAGGSLTVNAGAMLRSVFHSATINLGGGTVSNAGTIEGRAGGGLTI
ncbi:MAG TPA: hypothetical protein VGH15_02575, partial [Caulobacteraceae bacterium]